MMSSLSVVLLFAIVTTAHAQWFGNSREKLDCQVTFWSEWDTSTAWEATSKTRTRHVLRHPVNGGEACPDLVETQVIDKTERIELTATKMVSSFLSSSRIGRTRVARSTGYRRDLLVIVDASGSIDVNDYESAKDNLARLLGSICPYGNPFSNNVHKAALLRYSTNVTEMFDFNTHASTSAVQSAIRSMGYDGESTCTGSAFEYARQVMFSPSKGMRNESDVRQEVLILTDGQSNCGMDAIAKSGLLKQANVGVYGLMIGSFTLGGRAEMEAYVSDVGTHLFAVENFQDLTVLVNRIESIVQQTPCLGFDIN